LDNVKEQLINFGEIYGEEYHKQEEAKKGIFKMGRSGSGQGKNKKKNK
jgi:hypothetical protein